MLTHKTWRRTVLIALTAIAMSAGLAWANHVRIEGNVEQPSSPGLAVVAPPNLQANLQADEIKAHEVRAQIIYANKIEADEVRGTIHQSRGIKISDTRGDLKAPEVAANIIYADTIKANSVVANDIYVRDLRRK
jgi:hypothetical protein